MKKYIREHLNVYIHTPKGIFSCVGFRSWKKQVKQSWRWPEPWRPQNSKTGHRAVWAPEVIKSSGYSAGKAHSTLAAFSTWGPPLAQRQSLPQAPAEPLPSHSVPQVDPPEMAGISKGGHGLGLAQTPPCGFRNHFIKDRYPGWGLRTWRKLYGQKKDLQSWRLWKGIRGKPSPVMWRWWDWLHGCKLSFIIYLC